MNILIISEWGGGLPLGIRFNQEGHNVKMWIQDRACAHVGDGLVDKVDDYGPHLDWSDLIITDYQGFGELCDDLRKEGYLVWGGTKVTDEWENERATGQALLKQAGMTILPTQGFSKADEAIAFIKANPGRYVVKPDGKIQDEKSLTYVGELEDGSDMISMLEHYKKWGAKIHSFELQKHISGVEVGVSGFFNGTDFLDPIEISFEHKKLVNGNIGPSTGEMGTTMFWTDKESLLYQETIEKLVLFLRQQHYIGYFDINCIATEKDIYPLEPTCRFGYPTVMLKMETIVGNLGELMFEIASGTARTFKVNHKIAACVVTVMPPFPFSDKETFDKYSKDALILMPEDKTGIYAVGIRKEHDEMLQTLGDGEVCVCTGSGETISEALSLAYTRVKQIIAPNLFYRTDIGATWESDLSRLSGWGWL